MAEDGYDPPSRYEWSYIDNLRARATEWGTVNQPAVVKLLAKLEAEATRRHGERPR